jgi:7-carboxy-7-deazaguanine synthase
MSIDDINQKTFGLFPPTIARGRQLIVITGGEPFRQNIGPLVDVLMNNRAMVQIESNGTLPPPDRFRRGVQVVCSPKGRTVNKHLIPFISAYKYVVKFGAIDQMDGLPTEVLGQDTRPARPHEGFLGCVFISPMDEQSAIKNIHNLTLAASVCKTYGYIFNPQIHKLADLP